MSAMLAYLLNPNQDHGLGDRFLNNFLELANQQSGIYTEIMKNESKKYEIDLEVQYQNNGKRSDIDVQIKVLDSSYNEIHRIIIENKIRSGASNPIQLKEYYSAVLEDRQNDDSFDLQEENLSVIFLTPNLNHKGLKEEFNNLDVKNKAWLYWNSHDLNAVTVVKLIQNILESELKAEIPPINEYLRHTLKAFSYYITKTINHVKTSEDNSEVRAKNIITIQGLEYMILLRKSGQIQLFDSEGDKVQARPLLRQYLCENNLTERDNCQTTRCFGNQIMKHLKSI